MRCRAFRLPLENLGNGLRDPRAALGCAFALADLIGIFGALARALLDLALFGRWQVDACASCLRQSDGDGLLGRTRTVLATADLFDLLAHELAGLRAG